jgi:hypothetical protein
MFGSFRLPGIGDQADFQILAQQPNLARLTWIIGKILQYCATGDT